MKSISSHPSITYADDLIQICEPLKKLGIEYFSHVMIDDKNQFSSVGMNPGFVNLYYEKKYYNFDIHRSNSPMNSGYVFWDYIERDPRLNDVYEDFKAFSLGHSFTIIQQSNGCKHYYDFSTALNNDSINQIYFRHFDFLQKFILHFNEKVNTHTGLKKSYDWKVVMDEKQENKIGKNLTESLSIKRIYFSPGVYLTLRELECLHWLSHGKTIEDIANILLITTRTMKAHIANIKGKLNCTNHFQLGIAYQAWRGNNTLSELITCL